MPCRASSCCGTLRQDRDVEGAGSLEEFFVEGKFFSSEILRNGYFTRENGGSLGMIPLNNQPYTLYTGYLLGISPFEKDSLRGQTARGHHFKGITIFPMSYMVLDKCHPPPTDLFIFECNVTTFHWPNLCFFQRWKSSMLNIFPQKPYDLKL